jgi:FtsP/CotA-like multicopper oxidase with cupredoxin domain
VATRRFLKLATGGAGVYLTSKFGFWPRVLAQIPGGTLPPEDAAGVVRPPEAWETGPKDTVISYPGEITRVKMTFDRPGQFVWHCHILEHEDNEMMRPYSVGPIQNPTE